MPISQSAREISRRTALTALGSSLAWAAVARGEFYPYLDPTTETPVVRLTSPATSSLLPAPENRFIAKSRRFLVFSSNRTGSLAPFRLDLRSAALEKLAEPRDLQPRSLSLDPLERRILFLDGKSLCETSIGGRRTRVIRENVDAFGISQAGQLFLLADGRLSNEAGQVLATDAAAPVVPALNGTGCFFMRAADEASGLWWASLPNASSRPVPKLLASGAISHPFAANAAVLYLLRNGTATQIRQATVSGNDRLLVPGTRLGAFAPNRDATVFAGASRSKAQPFIVLILRTNGQEMVLCEHHASSECPINPVFSPDSRRLYFESDRDGKPALYSVNVQALVEPT